MGEAQEDLMKRFNDLEVSQAKLREQLEVLLRNGGEQKDKLNRRGREREPDAMMMAGNFVRNPYQMVLHQLGHALHICRPASWELIYWNRAAEVLYGWKSYEALSQKVFYLLIDERSYSYWESIMERACGGEMWSGLFSFRKSSGESFVAMLTVNPLYENGVCIGVVTVSSDASMLSKPKLDRSLTHSDEGCSQPRETWWNSKRVVWFPPPLITSSVSYLAEKVLAKLQILANGSQASELERNSETNSACVSADDSFQIDQRREISRPSTIEAKYVQEKNSGLVALGRNYHKETRILVSHRNGSTSLAHCCATQMENNNVMHIEDNLIKSIPELSTISKSSTSPKRENMWLSKLSTSIDTSDDSESGLSTVGEIEPSLVADSEICWEDLVLGEEIGEAAERG